MGRGVGALVLAVVAGLVLAGCTSEPRASVLPPVTETPTPPGSASPTPSVEAEVEAAVRAYVAALNEAFSTGETSHARSLTLEGCPCLTFLTRIDKTWQKGSMEGLKWNVSSVKVHDVHGQSAAAEVQGHVSPYRILASGQATEVSDGGVLHEDYSMLKVGGKWLVAGSFDLR